MEMSRYENPEESFLEESEESLYTHAKQRKFRFLNYIQQNYFKVIFILTSITITLVLLLLLLIADILFIQRDTNDSKLIDFNHSSSLNFGVYAANDTGRVLTPEEHYEIVPCRKINCATKEQPCNITDVEYRSIKQYSCCGCLDKLRLFRYEKILSSNTVYMVITGYPVDPCGLSDIDVEMIPSLKCLEGSWDIVIESDTTCYLRYNIISAGCFPELEV